MPAHHQQLFSIGAFSNIVGIPVSTLHLYDQANILVPDQREMASSYRRYTPNQIIDAFRLLQLQRMGLSLMEIKRLMLGHKIADLRKDIEAKLLACEQAIEEEKAHYDNIRQTYDQLGFQIGDAEPEYHPEAAQQEFMIDRQPQTAIVSYPLHNADLTFHTLSRAYGEIMCIGMSEKLELNGPMSILFQDGGPEKGRRGFLLFYPIAATSRRHEHIQSLGGFWTVSAIHIGSYTGINRVYENLEHYLKQKDLVSLGLSYEEYLINHFNGVSEDSYITKVSIAIKEPYVS